ncbi:MAG TPA: hypothetical protein VHY48_05935 [Acidobacteriaceae bacterium]|nr:hypothetical protein [Acidobacteriaceae bacterium]
MNRRRAIRLTHTVFASILAAALFAFTGCKSPYIATTVVNDSGAPVSLIEVDYPSASFGRDALAAGASFPYRFKIIGSGPTKISWTDTAHHDHNSTGPTLEQGEHGPLVITLTSTGSVSWSAHLTP